MGNHRRQFLKESALGVAATAGLASAVSSARAQGGPGRRQWPADLPPARFGRKRGASGRQGIVVSSHPLATRAGVEILRAGGNACDAALAVSITQTVVEPHMTTITGVLSLLYHDAASGKTTYMNGGMNAPLAGLPRFSGADAATGRGCGVPSFWPAFEAALRRHGSRPKAELCAAAIHYARDGFPIHPFLYGMMFEQVARIGRTPAGREIYLPEGVLLDPGATLRQARAARTLERLVEEGESYWRGEFARRYAEVVQADNGVITPEDFERYDVRWQEPAWGSYRGYEIAASPPPDNGGTHIIEALNLIELLDLKRLGPPTESPDTLYQLVKINNEVMLEGAKQTDPKSHPVPLDLIVSKEYARMRFALLQMAPERAHAYVPVPPGSNHVTVADGRGNVATILHSVMSYPWTNGLFVDGVSIAASGAHFTRVMPRPGHRASAYVAPNLLFKDGVPILASGSPSVGLIANILQNTINILDFGIPIEASVHRPRFGGWARGARGANYVEADLDPKVRDEVARRGVSFEVVNPWGVHQGSFEGVYRDPATGILSACADPRRTGHAEAV